MDVVYNCYKDGKIVAVGHYCGKNRVVDVEGYQEECDFVAAVSSVKDANGTEFQEGDIVYIEKYKWVGVVVWNGKYGRFEVVFPDCGCARGLQEVSEYAVVVGNVYHEVKK